MTIMKEDFEPLITLKPITIKRLKTGYRVLLGLALVAPALMFLSTFGGDAEWAQVVDDSFLLLVCLAIGLSIVASLLYVVHWFGTSKKSDFEIPTS